MMGNGSQGGLDAGADHGPRVLLADHHREIEAVCRGLMACSYADDPHALNEYYRRFERALLEHLSIEEQEILPAYTLVEPDEARALLDDHARLRNELFRIGLEVELHTLRLETIERLIADLRAHAVREDRAMYPWAQLHLPLDRRHQLGLRIARSLASLAELRRKAPTAA